DAGEGLVLEVDVVAGLRAIALGELVAELRQLAVLRLAGVGLRPPEGDAVRLVREPLLQTVALLARRGERALGLGEALAQLRGLRERAGQLELAVRQLFAQALRFLCIARRGGALALQILLRRGERARGLFLFALELGLVRGEALVLRVQPAQRGVLAFLV